MISEQDKALLQNYIKEWTNFDRSAPPQVSLSINSFLEWYSEDYVNDALNFIKHAQKLGKSLDQVVHICSTTVKEELSKYPIFKKLDNIELLDETKNLPELIPEGKKRMLQCTDPNVVFLRIDMIKANFSSLRLAHKLCLNIGPDDFQAETWSQVLEHCLQPEESRFFE